LDFLFLKNNPGFAAGIFSLSDQGSNLDFPESKSGVLPVTPSDNTSARMIKPAQNPKFGIAKVELFFKNDKTAPLF
jgi:hypothetical protein